MKMKGGESTMSRFRILLGHPRVRCLIAVSILLTGLLGASSQHTSATPSRLQIGWFTGAGRSDLTRIDTQQQAGESIQFAYASADLSAATISAYLTKLQQANVRTFLQLDPTAAKAGDTATLLTFVNTYKSHPSVAGWLIYDEPEFNGVWASKLVTDYKAVKAADPNHPVAIIFGNGYCTYVANSLDSNYFNAADVILFDSYPVNDQPEFGTTVDGKHSFSDYPYVVNNCLSYVGGLGKSFMMIAQGFQWTSPGPSGQPNRNPTYGEERYFTFMPFIHNVAGLVYWVDYRADAALTATVNRVMKEASTLGLALLNGVYNDPSVSVNNAAISYKYGSDGTNMLLIAENDTGLPVTAAFTLPATVNTSSVTLVYDGYNAATQSYTARSIPVSTGPSGRPTFTDTFTQYQVHIYQLTGSNPPTATGTDTIGGYSPSTGMFYLRNSNASGMADYQFRFGPAGAGWKPLAGDWNGAGTVTIGGYNPTTGVFYLRNSNSGGIADYQFQFGPAGAGWLPLAGDWNGDGTDTIGGYSPANGMFYLRNSNSGGIADYQFQFGPAGAGWLPVAGDWNGDGTDTIGGYNPTTGVFYLRNSNSGGSADYQFQFGPAGAGLLPIAGDWNADGIDSIGLYSPTTGMFYLRNSNSGGIADYQFQFGPAGTGWLPIAGDWNGTLSAVQANPVATAVPTQPSQPVAPTFVPSRK
jgi:hypothetical protein